MLYGYLCTVGLTVDILPICHCLRIIFMRKHVVCLCESCSEQLLKCLQFRTLSAHLGLSTGHNAEPAEQMHQRHLHFQLSQPHAHTVTGTGPERQIHKGMSTGLGLRCEPRRAATCEEVRFHQKENTAKHLASEYTVDKLTRSCKLQDNMKVFEL